MVRLALVITEPAGISAATSNRTRARRSAAFSVEPANRRWPAPFARSPFSE
jgi:hypothetical protein